jgi:hypothetical protein
MSESQRAALLAFYAAVLATLALIDRSSGLYRALCQVRTEIERACGLPETPTSRQRAIR